MSEKLLPAVAQPSTGTWLMILEQPEKLYAMAEIMVASGMFEPSDAEEKRGMTEKKAVAQAIVKIQAGFEYGLTPFIAMRSLHSIKGKITPSYQLMLSKVRQAGYDYKVVQKDSNGAKIEWLDKADFKDEERTVLGVSKFDADDAAKANLAGGNWVKYRSTMMFARAVSQGVNTYCPEVFNGPVYTPEDFNATLVGDELIVEQTMEDQVKTRAAEKASEKAKGKKKEAAEPQPDSEDAQVIQEIQTTAEDALEAIKEVAEENNKLELAAAAQKSLENIQKPKRNMGSAVMAGAKNKWKPAQVQAYMAKEYAAEADELTDLQWDELLKHVRNFPPVGL